jgi:hypothetical protein
MREDSMAEIILYVDANFGGLHTHFWGSVAQFTQMELFGTGVSGSGNWNDKVSSFVIQSGYWQFFKDEQFQTQQGKGNNASGLASGTFGPGEYSWVQDWGIDNDALSSIKLIRD